MSDRVVSALSFAAAVALGTSVGIALLLAGTWLQTGRMLW